MEVTAFPQWSRLCDDLKLQVISGMDFKTRRQLRKCSREDRQLVGRFQWRETTNVECRFCTSTGKWYCNDYLFNRWNLKDLTKFFNTREEAYFHMKELIRSAEEFFAISIESTLDSRIKLTDARRLINVYTFCWKLNGGENHNESKWECYNFLFNQINLLELKKVEIDMYGIEFLYDPMQNESFFEIERTKMNLSYLNFSGSINDEQFAGIRAHNMELGDCRSLTPSGFARFIKKRILQPTPDFYCRFFEFSDELQLQFFGELCAPSFSSNIELMFNVVGSDDRLCVTFHFHDDHERMNETKVISNKQHYNDDDNNGRYYNWYIEMELKTVEQIPMTEEDIMRYQRYLLEKYPTLGRFVAEIAEGLPLGFYLLGDWRDHDWR